ncbi:P-loop containing nucleoside triphosphate hydrolase protein [Paraphaeosphaeria sporulosa]|uniref:Structural maintenance of chromosomes protein 5 n=1 Tax=Paraphaeosphaeria sporulosa TaxID=1460663 RepID=A0A177CDQ5_9PLEO|nr:P-loop containing nucleoside triphosphate hydrolase protein [Paraphaeosphaeria sporulosa]OAG04898.1 P-loop containing nucleoside triphosphate hydrolase protein [Paraphaeosphaeria sporulosa]
MPGIPEKRKRPTIRESDDEEQPGVSDGSASKRARSISDASGSPSSNHSHHRLPEDVHQPGSLVRVKLTNFVTYTSAEFHLGPSLNMIIGPNGTGKSTLVCAICLGLGWGPQYLGRAKEIGEFVKHGSAEAEIEIELAASGNRKNPVIRRRIQKEGNKTMFYINDVYKSQKDVKALAENFSIQINNLCQFLPQDRVVEFAKMDPIAMLGETLRAASSGQMVEWHDELKRLRTDEKASEREQQNEQHHLKALQAKQSSTREDVDRYLQRQGLVTKARDLETCRPFIHYNAIRAERSRIQADIQAGTIDLNRYESEAEPIRRAEAEMESDKARIERVSNTRKHRFEVKKSAVDRFEKKIDNDQKSLGQLAAQINAEKQDEKQRRQDVRRLENEIINLKHQHENNTVEYDPDSFRSRLADIRARKSAAERKQNAHINEITRIREETVQITNDMHSKQKEKEHLNSRSGQQDSILSNLSPDTHTAWTWLKANIKSLSLKDKVYGPPIIECSVPDPKYADAVEAMLRLGDLTALTCTNKEDAQKVQNKLVGKKDAGGLGLHQVTIRTVPLPRSSYSHPLTSEELANFSFEGWISDYIEGPDAVLAMLCDNVKIHATAYSSRKMTTGQYNTLERNERLQKWIAGNQVYAVTRRREYGISSTSINTFRKAKHFTGQPVATAEITLLENAIKELERDVTMRKERHVAKAAEFNAAKLEIEEAEAERAKVQAEQDQLKKAYATWEALPRRIATKQSDLAGITSQSDDTNNRIELIRSQSEDLAMSVARDTLSYAKEVVQLRALQESYLEAEIRLIEATSEVDGLKNDNREIIEAIEEQRQALAVLKTELDAKTAEARHLKRQLQAIIVSDDVKELIIDFKDLPMERLDDEISAVNSRLELMADGNPQAIRAYEDREREIRKVEQTLADTAEKLEHTRTRITEIREQWEPELDRIVSAISDGFAHNFDRIGCAGQVSVKKDEDFDKWAIQIEVSFRENEPLAVLDSHRQSGGERAVSTIFYLMALQGLARSPFRVVDEINQGMDPRNERMVHERMVDIACQEHTSQYFLVTPKLLNDLKFHPKMKVHCIASGEFMPDSQTNLDFRSLAELAMRVRKGVAAA